MTGLACHAGTVGIGSSLALPLGGYGRRTAEAVSAGCGLEANWVLFYACDPPVLVLALDALFSSEAFERALGACLEAGGLGRVAIFAIASHTHYAPMLDPGKPRAGPADDAHIAWVADTIASDILAQIETLSAGHVAAWAFSQVPVAGSVFRRARRLRLSVRSWPPVRISMQIAPKPDRAIDRVLRLWQAEDSAGRTRFAVATWPCHATSRQHQDVASPDFVAAIRAGIRALYPECPVLFLPGASADIRTHFTRVRGLRRFYPYPFQACFAAPDAREEAALDARLAAAAQDCASHTAAHRPIDGLCYARTGIAHSELLQDAGPREMRAQCLRIGGVSFYGFGAELSSEWPAVLGLEADAQTTVLSGCVGPVCAYLPTDSQVPEGGYEVTEFRRAFRLQGRYDPAVKIAPALVQAIARLDRAAAV